nr:MAG TPA: hypothetical protein [Caudoviricetes sp.]
MAVSFKLILSEHKKIRLYLQIEPHNKGVIL